MTAEWIDPTVYDVVNGLRDDQARAALQSLVAEALNTWQNLDVFCADGQACCKRSVNLFRLYQLLDLLNQYPRDARAGSSPTETLPSSCGNACPR